MNKHRLEEIRESGPMRDGRFVRGLVGQAFKLMTEASQCRMDKTAQVAGAIARAVDDGMWRAVENCASAWLEELEEAVADEKARQDKLIKQREEMRQVHAERNGVIP